MRKICLAGLCPAPRRASTLDLQNLCLQDCVLAVVTLDPAVTVHKQSPDVARACPHDAANTPCDNHMMMMLHFRLTTSRRGLFVSCIGMM